MNPIFLKMAAATLMAGAMGSASATAGEKVETVAAKTSGVAVTVERAVKRGLKAAASGVKRGTQVASKGVKKGAEKIGIPSEGAPEPKQ